MLASALIGANASAQVPEKLERITVTAQQNGCPVTDDVAAHELWHAMACHYSPLLSLVPRTGQFARDGAYAAGSVQLEDLGSFSTAESEAQSDGGLRNALHGIVLTSPVFTAAKSRMSRNEYASRVPDEEPRLLYQPVYLNWYYARLDGLFLDHFVDTAFEARHDVSRATLSGGTMLTFCGRDHSRPWIEGTMEITRDTHAFACCLQLYHSQATRRRSCGGVA